MLRLRGHHLICLHFFRGEGYNQEFVENLENVMHRAANGEEIEVVEGADDICRACPTLKGKECVAKPGVDVEIREMDAEAVAYLGVDVNSKVRWKEIKVKVIALSRKWLVAFCEGCEWEKVCTEKKKVLELG